MWRIATETNSERDRRGAIHVLITFRKWERHVSNGQLKRETARLDDVYNLIYLLLCLLKRSVFVNDSEYNAYSELSYGCSPRGIYLVILSYPYQPLMHLLLATLFVSLHKFNKYIYYI